MTYWLETLETEMGALPWRSATRARAAADACGSMSRWVRAMKILLRLCLLAVIGLPAAALIAVWLCFQDAPLIARTPSITPADIDRAKRIVEKHDPRKARPGTLRTIVASPQDLDLALNYAAGQFLNGSTRVVLQPGHALVQASLEVARNPLGRWLNVDAALRETGGLPAFDHLRIGRLPVPGYVADLVLATVLAQLNATADGRLAPDVVKSIKISAEGVRVVYEWRDDIPERVSAVLLPPADQDRLRAYSDRLAEVVATLGVRRSVSLSRLLPPLFAVAHERSTRGDAVKENRAAIVTLAFYSNGRGLSAIIPAAKAWRRAAPLTVTLNGRDDFPKHFLISAAIAAEAGSPLADAIGLYKEVEDSRGGSGFSFADIAANRAGTRFGELALKAPQRLQQTLAAGVQERDFMPEVSDLPELMPEAEFKQRYGGIGAPAYERVMADIERRVASVALFCGIGLRGRPASKPGSSCHGDGGG